MIFAFVFSILTATYTLSSNNTVNEEGEVPAYSNYHYERSSTTGQRGQMTAGNTTHLRLSGWDGCTIRSVTLNMHSNSKSGGGSLKMKVGKRVLWEIDEEPFSSNNWAGKYSSEWLDVSKTIDVTVGNHEAIDILITATENSLYINRYTIEYESAPPTCYLVSFVTGVDSVPASITQSAIGAPIVLPMWRDTAGWYFQGWSEVGVEEDMVQLEWMVAGSEYIPRTNTYLWAVYSDVKEVSAVTDYTSGQYVITMWNATTINFSPSGMAMASNVKDGEVYLCEANMMRNNRGQCCLMTVIEDDMIYELDLKKDSTLSIVHIQTGDTIGHKNTRLSNNENMTWQYKILADSSLIIYFVDKEKPTNTYVLHFGISSTSEEKYPVGKAQFLDIAKWEKGGLWLFPIVYPKYTTWPFGKPKIEDDIDNPSSILSEGQYLMNIGHYRLYVKDGKKYLFL